MQTRAHTRDTRHSVYSLAERAECFLWTLLLAASSETQRSSASKQNEHSHYTLSTKRSVRLGLGLVCCFRESVRLQPELHTSLPLTSPASLSLPRPLPRPPAYSLQTLPRALGQSLGVRRLSLRCVYCLGARCLAQISSCGQCSPIWLIASCISRWTWRCRSWPVIH